MTRNDSGGTEKQEIDDVDEVEFVNDKEPEVLSEVRFLMQHQPACAVHRDSQHQLCSAHLEVKERIQSLRKQLSW